MIENLSTLVSKSKIVDSIRRRNNIIDIEPSATSIEEAKAKVQKIIDSGRKRDKKKN